MIDNNFNKNQYQENTSTYLTHNQDGSAGGGSVESRVELLKKYLPKGRTVFEIGSGGGNDAMSLHKNGYEVIATDFVGNFIKILKEKGLNVLLFDAKKEEIPRDIDAIFANAVFVHFTPEEVKHFLQKAKLKLQNEKIIFISVLKGEGSERSARKKGFERDFQYYTLESISGLLNDESFEVMYSDDDGKWLQFIGKGKF